MPTNEERVNRIIITVAFYKQYALGESGPSGEKDDITDLLTDLRHYCRHNNIPFGQCVSMSEMHYHAELEEERRASTCRSKK